MKTKPLSRNLLKIVSCILLLFWTTNSVFGQCPTITDSSPPPICDVSGYTFADLNTFATNGGNGIVWYSVATGGTAYFDTELVSEGTYYADDNSGTCGSRASITVSFEVSPSGQNLDRLYCSNENPTVQTYIDDVLQAYIPSGGSVEIYNDSQLTDQANGTDAITMGAFSYYIIFINNSGCESQIEIGSVGVFNAPPDPTPASPQLLCSTSGPTIANLDPGTTASHSWYVNLDVFGNPVQPALSSSTPLIDGNTYYVQVDDFFCDSNPIPVTVTIDTPVDPGTPANLEYCEDNIPTADFDLFGLLGVGQNTTGSWTGPTTISNGHLGTVNIALLTAPSTNVFTYTVPSNGACPDGVSTVTITLFEILTSGTPSASNPASYCEANLPTSFDLFSLLDNEDPNGQWTQGTSSSDPSVASTLSLVGFAPGTYNFTYTQNALPNPCLEESTTIEVMVLQDPNAGNAVNQIFCENDIMSNSPFDLFNALDGTQDNNSGIWTDSSNTTISNAIDITSFTVSGSPYAFNYTIDNGTCSDTETITITIEPAPESGTPIATFPEFCEDVASTSYNLFDLLDNEDQTGTWFIGTDNTGASIGNPTDLSVLGTGILNFTFDVNQIGSCDDALVTVSVTINPLPNAGNAINQIFCENDIAANSPFDLFDALDGTQDNNLGIWTDVSDTTISNSLDITSFTVSGSPYAFNYTIDNGTCSDTETITITIEPAPESGTPSAPLEFCAAELSTGQTVDLFDLLEGEDQTGTWTDDDSSGALVDNQLTIDGLSDGTYNFTFDVNAIGSCDDVLVTVSVIINDPPPPTASSSQSFCDAGTLGDIVVTGTNIKWYDQATGGTSIAGTIDLTDGGTYYATQTDPTTGCESSVRTLVAATVNQTPVVGNPASSITECNNNSNIDLFTTLDGTQNTGGVWQDTDGTSAVSGSVLDATSLVAGTYSFTYFIAATTPCVDQSVSVTITIEEALNPGTPTSINMCSDNGVTDLFTLLGAADTGGTWSPTLTSGTGVFDPLVDPSGTYTYSLTNACGIVSSDVVVSVIQTANAGTDASITVCVDDGLTDLFASLGGADTGGTWSPALLSGTGVFDPNSDLAGVYTYMVAATAPCVNGDSAEVTVTIEDSTPPIAITQNPEFCLVDNPTVSDLDNIISSSGTLIWYDDAAQTIVLNASDTLIDGEDYYGTQANTSACQSSMNTQINVTINDMLTPSLINSNLELCINDNPTINDLTLNITEYDSLLSNVIWYDSPTNGTLITSTTNLSNTTKYYAVLYDAVTGCESSIRLEVTPDLTSCGELVLPDGFSPNGDGTNDTYDYNNLDILYPNFVMEIYNRYGSIVYKGNANTQRFNGKSNQSGTLGKGDLPVGVYFYIFNYNDGTNKPEQGRLYLSR